MICSAEQISLLDQRRHFGSNPILRCNSAGLFFGDNIMKEIPLTQGKVALVDDEDFEKLSQLKWYALKQYSTFYAVRSPNRKSNVKRCPIRMHRFILNLTEGDIEEVDHKNRNGLDNRKQNLRVCTHTQNLHNQAKTRRRTTSKYKGVYLHSQNKNWIARINHNNVCCHLGCFDCEEDAARMYDKKAVKLQREFAWLNFPSKQEIQDVITI